MDMLRSTEYIKESFASTHLEKIKIVIQYACVTVLFAIGGGAFTYLLDAEDYLSFFNRVYVHITLPFSECKEPIEALKILLRYSLPRYILAVVILLFSFSVLNHLVSQLVLIWESGKLGFSCMLLGRMVSSEAIRTYIPTKFCVLYTVTSVSLLIACFVYTIRMANHSMDSFSRANSGRAMISLEAFRRLFTCFFRYCIGLFLVYMLYGLLIFLL